jgi:Holliday junction resolvase RusA-like endonuclease
MIKPWLSFTVPGVAVAKGRARVVKGHAYTPEKTKTYGDTVGWIARDAMGKIGRQLTLEPVYVEIDIGVPIPKGFGVKRRAAALSGELHPTQKPDLDNIIKSIYDSMNKIAYKDDAQIVKTLVKKIYAPEPYAEVRVWRMIDLV